MPDSTVICISDSEESDVVAISPRPDVPVSDGITSEPPDNRDASEPSGSQRSHVSLSKSRSTITPLSAPSPANSVQQVQSDEHNPANGSSRGTKAYASLKAAAKRAGWIQQYQDLERGLQSAAEKPRGRLPEGVQRIAELREYNTRRLKGRQQGAKSPSESAAIAVAQNTSLRTSTILTDEMMIATENHSRITYARGIMRSANVVSDTLDLPEERRGKHNNRRSLLRLTGVKQGIMEYYASLKSGEVGNILTFGLSLLIRVHFLQDNPSKTRYSSRIDPFSRPRHQSDSQSKARASVDAYSELQDKCSHQGDLL